MIKRQQALILTLLLTLASFAFPVQQQTADIGAGDKKFTAEVSPVLPVGVKYNSANHPDPFLNPNLAKKKNDDNEEEPRAQAPPGIAGMAIDRVKLLGTVFNNEPTAVFLGTDQRSYFLLESDRLYDGYVKQIGAEAVILVRETKYRSGKITTQEVIKRLRTP